MASNVAEFTMSKTKNDLNVDAILLVDKADLSDLDPDLTHIADIKHLDIEECDMREIDMLRPSMVFSRLVLHQFDALDVAESLENIGFTGAYRVVTDRCPKPEIVRKEVREVAPNLDFDVISAKSLKQSG